MKRILNLIVILLVLPASCSNKQYSDDFSRAKLSLMEAESAAWLEGRSNTIYWDNMESRTAESEEIHEKNYQENKNVIQAMDKIRNPPKAYAQAQSKLFEAYGVYLNLYSLVQRNRYGKKEDYEANIQEENRKWDSIWAQVSALDPTPRH